MTFVWLHRTNEELGGGRYFFGLGVGGGLFSGRRVCFRWYPVTSLAQDALSFWPLHE